MAEPISLLRLSIALIPVAILLAWLWWDGHRLNSSLQGLARMLIQLSLVGYALVFLFESDQAWITLGTLTVMMLVASAIAVRNRRARSWTCYAHVLLSIFFGGGATLAIMAAGVLEVTPWYQPRILIPLAGMTFSNCMNALSLAIERLDSIADQVLTTSAPAQEPSKQPVSDGTVSDGTREQAVSVALIPITNSLFAVGVVSIPGMMTGQVLAGVSPLIAARYQIMIMCLVFASAGLSLMIFMKLHGKTKPNDH